MRSLVSIEQQSPRRPCEIEVSSRFVCINYTFYINKYRSNKVDYHSNWNKRYRNIKGNDNFENYQVKSEQ